MTTKRKAELQRKLAIAPVAKPPAGLADRIKGEIPKHLVTDTSKERARFRQSIAFNVRVAASIILLVSSVYLALHLLSRRFGPPEMMSTAAKEPVATATTAVALPTTPPPPMSTEAKAEAQARKPIVVAESRRQTLSDGRAKKQNEETTNTLAETAQAPAGAAADSAAPSAAAAPMPAPPPPVAESITITASAPPMAKTAALSFDLEASAAPFDAGRQIVRVSLDGYRDAAPDVAFNDDAVASWHLISSDGTSLYEITLRPQTGRDDIIATARVGSAERVIRRSDLHSWDEASRRMKAAALAAALEAGVPPKDVAAKARAAGLDDLAKAAEARARKQQP
jgi:hypothetical protein